MTSKMRIPRILDYIVFLFIVRKLGLESALRKRIPTICSYSKTITRKFGLARVIITSISYAISTKAKGLRCGGD